jgi:hypothetical protein
MTRNQAAAIIAGTVADAIRERLVTYTPVANGHQALILAYTYRQARALTRFCAEANLDQAPYADTWAAVDDAARAADAAGFTVPSLPEE